MGGIECASKAVKNVTGGMDWILQPFGDWVNKSYGYLLSTTVVLPSAVILHRGAVFLVGKLPHPSLNKDPETLLSFPGVTLDVGNLFAQGALLNAMKQLFKPEKDPIGVALACVSFVMLLAYGGWIAHLHRTRTSRGIHYGKFRYAHQKVPVVLRPFLMPIARWFPRICKYRYASTLNCWKEDRLFFAYVPLVSMLLNASIAAYNAKTPEQCDYQYIALGAIPIIQSLMFIVLQPFRHRILTPLNAGARVIVGFAIASPAIPAVQEYTSYLVTAVTVTSALAGGFGVFLALFERMRLKEWEKQLAAQENEEDSAHDDNNSDSLHKSSAPNASITSPLLHVADPDSVEMQALSFSMDSNPLLQSSPSLTARAPRRSSSSAEVDL